MLKRTFLGVLASLLGVFAILIAILPTPESAALPETQPPSLAIENVRIFDGERVYEAASLVVQDGIIVGIGTDIDIPENADRVDGAGMTLLPGLIDAHTHTYGPALTDSLRFGVTSNIDMFMAADALAPLKAARVLLAPTDKADVFSAGTLATVAGGHGTQFGLPVPPLSKPGDAPGWVAQRKLEGSDFIKLVYIPNQTRIPSLDLATATAVIEAAHENGLLAVAHISTEAAAIDMVEAGIDGLVHMFADVPVSDGFVAMARQADLFIVPTLTVLATASGTGDGAALAEDEHLAPYLSAAQANNLPRNFGGDIPGFSLAIGQANTKALHAAGVAILAGSDAPNPGTAHGASLHHELDLLVRAGLSPLEALIAASSAPANRFGLAGRGRLQKGARADMLLVRGNPLTDITRTRDIAAIYKNGHKTERMSAASQETGSAPISHILGQFETGLDAPDGLIWTSTTDSVAGGKSEAAIASQTDGDGGVLSVEATISPGFPYPWAGAYLTVTNPNTAARDLSGFTHLNFRIKGTQGTYRVMMFDTGLASIPPTQTIEVDTDWRDVSLPLEAFRGFTETGFVGLAIVAGPAQGDFQYQIDDVILQDE